MIKTRRSPWLFFLFLTLAAASCRVDRTEDPVVIVTADPEFNVDLFEYRDPVDGHPTFGLWIESLSTYDSTTFIVAGGQLDGSAITVQVSGIEQPADAVDQAGTATAFVPLGNPANGVYTFHLSLGSIIVNKGTLTVADGHYELSVPEPNGVIFQNMVLEHLPEGMIWGYAETPTETQEPVADAFILDLKTITSDPGLAPGFYGYFTVTGAGSTYFHNSFVPKGQAEPFVRKLSGTPGELHNLLQSYRSNGQTDLSIRCMTTSGEQ